MRARFRVTNAGNQLRSRMRTFTEPDESFREMPVRMHRHVPGDVVKNVWFGQIIELVRTPDGDRSRKLAIPQAIEKQERRDVAANRFGLEPCQGLQEPVNILQTRNLRRIEAQGLDAFQKMLVGVAMPARKDSGVESAPSLVVLFRVQIVRLVNIKLTMGAGFFDERGLSRGQAGALQHRLSRHGGPPSN